MKRTFSTVLLLAGVTLSAHAFADTLHIESRQNLTFGVIDLTPADGQAASFSFSNVRTDYLRMFSTPGSPNWVRRDILDGTAPADFSSSHYGASSTASFTGSPGDFTLTADGTDALGRSGSAMARIEQTFTVTLSAHSVLTLAAENYTASTLLAGSPATFEEEFYSSISMTGGAAGQSYSYYDAGPLDPAETFERWLAIANTSDTAIDIAVSLSTWNRLRVVQEPTPLAPVPEPSTWGMMMAGLGLTWGAARRRASRRQGAQR